MAYLAAAIAALVGLSLTACIVFTTVEQTYAFFLLPTRAWELGAGALVAVAIPAIKNRIPQALSVAGSWLGLGAILASAVRFDSDTQFPGMAAIVPVLGAVALIVFGDASGRGSTRQIMSFRPLVFLGTISYSLYLVHWPLLTIPRQASGFPQELSFTASTLLVALSFVAAWLLFVVVEKPVLAGRGWSNRTATNLVAAGVFTMAASVVAVGGISLLRYVPLDSGAPAATQAVSMSPQFSTHVPSNLDPQLSEVREDNPILYAEGCHADFGTEDPIGCEFGSNQAPLEIVLFGDSHAAQWFPAFQPMLDGGMARVIVHTKSSCPSVDVLKYREGSVYTECSAWRQAVIGELSADPVDLVIVSNFADTGGFRLGGRPEEAWGAGLERTLEALRGAAQESVVIADTPHFAGSPPVCLSANLSEANRCSLPRDHAIHDGFADSEREAAQVSGSDYVDLNDFLCSDTECGPIIGNRLVYRDSNHLTASASSDLSGPLLQALDLHEEAGQSAVG